jgi:cell division protein FtsB
MTQPLSIRVPPSIFLVLKAKKVVHVLARDFLRITTMATRHTNTNAAGGGPQRLGRRILIAFFGFVVCVLVVDALVGDRGLVATIRARQQYSRLATDLARLRMENTTLREEARRLREDPAAIEEIARRELGLMSPGEKLFIVKDIPDPSTK